MTIDQTHNQQTPVTTETTIKAAGQDGGPPAKPKSNRGFASMDPARQREIASKGGHASGGNFANNRQRAVEAGRKGGQRSSGNFANDRERAADAGRKGGQASSGQRQVIQGNPTPEERH